MGNAILSVKQLLTGDELRIMVDGPIVQQWPANAREIWRTSIQTLKELNIELSNSLDGLKEELGSSLPGDAKRAAKALGEYVRSYTRLWSDSSQDTYEFKKRRQLLNELLMKAASPPSTLEDIVQTARVAPEIEILATRQIALPLEVIPLGQHPLLGTDLRSLAFSLLIFRGAIRYVIYGSDREMTNGGATYVATTGRMQPTSRALIRGTNTKMWNTMQRSLAASPTVPFIGCAPEKGRLEKAADIAGYILSPWDFSRRSVAVSDVHVYAHGEVGTTRQDRFRIPIEYGWWLLPKGFPVRTLEFEDAIEIANTRIQPRSPVFVWFNCCRAGGRVGSELRSLAITLAQAGVVTVAPRTDVPEPVATQLAANFYHYWDNGLNLGKALLAAKWRLLLDKDSPLSLLYYLLDNTVW